MNVRLSSAAEAEIAESANYYLEDSIYAATSFLDEIDEARTLIGRQPKLYPIHSGEVRVKRLDRFPFSLFYRIRIEEIYVLSVSHDSREPNYWENR